MIESVPFILLMDWQLMKIPYIQTLFLGYESKDKNQEEQYLESHLEKKGRESEITPATSTSQEEEVPLQANFIDENFDINM